MIKEISFLDSPFVKDLYELQKAAYMIEAKLIHFYEIPPLKESFEEFSQCGETFLGYFEEKKLAGAISYIVDGNELTICRLVVHPDQFRRGISQKLLEAAEKENGDCSVFKVTTGKENIPARSLYLKNGFYHHKDIEVAPGFFISSYIRKAEIN